MPKYVSPPPPPRFLVISYLCALVPYHFVPKAIDREMNELRTQINRLKQEGGIILTGDFNAKINIDQPNCKQATSRNGKYLEELIKETGLIPISAKATRGRWTRQHRTNPTEKSIIDYILVDENTNKQIEEIIVDEEGTHRIRGNNDSDHNTILLTLNTTANRETQKITNWKKPTKESWNNFNKIIDSNKNNLTDYQSLYQNIIHTLEEAIGSQTITLTKKRKESDETKRLRREKNKIKKELQIEIKNNSPNKTETLEKYIESQKALKEHIETEIRGKTVQIANKLIEAGGTKSQLFWKMRKKITNTKTKNTYDTITEEGVKIEDPGETKNHIADFYENLYQAREGKPDYQNWTDHITNKVKELNTQSKSCRKPEKATIQELNKTIKHLKNNKAPGPDKLPNEIFTHANHQT